MRDTSFTITKAIAIILVVISHAGAPTWLNHFIFQFHVPIFFLCAGYFFRPQYVLDGRPFVAHRLKQLYWPFVKWSIFFLVIHNVLFPLGLLSETYGNAAGGVLHPYSWHDFCQRCWSVVFNLSGYDEFLCGAFWFFRTFLIANLAFLLGVTLLVKGSQKTTIFSQLSLKVESGKSAMTGDSSKVNDGREEGTTPIAKVRCLSLALKILLLVVVLLTLWKIFGGLRVTGVFDGGYRELVGVALLCIGCLVRQKAKLRWLFTSGQSSNNRTRFLVFILVAGITIAGAYWHPTSMTTRGTAVDFFVLLVTAVAGWGMVHAIARLIDRYDNILRRALIYIGEHTLYIFAFHLLAFKVVSALKVALYHLPWQRVAEHTVVHAYNDDLFWVAYAIVGVSLPLLWRAGYHTLAARVDLSYKNCAIYTCRYLWRGTLLLWCGLRVAGVATIHALVTVATSLWHGFVGFFRALSDIIKASSPKDE